MTPRPSAAAAAPLLLAAFAVLAGCAAPAATPPSAVASSPPSGLAPFHWSDCRGAIVSLDGVAALYPSAAPPGWGPPDQRTVVLRVTLLECARLSWGAFERGPVSIAQEWRSDVNAPAACLGAESARPFLLESIWFSDAEVAEAARAQGLPAGLAGFAVQPSALGEEWSWGPPGAEPSSIRIATAPEGDYSDVRAHRLLWADGEGVGALDLLVSWTFDKAPRAAAGMLHPPTLYGRANAAPGFASARGFLPTHVEADGVLHRFGDPACTQPL